MASAARLSELSPSAELALQTQLAESESRLSSKQHAMADVTSQLHDHREALAGLQQVCFSGLLNFSANCRAMLCCAVLAPCAVFVMLDVL